MAHEIPDELTTSAIQRIVQAAIAHEKGCEETADHNEDCPAHHCWEYRRELAARVMYELNLDLTDIGFVADSLLEISYTEATAKTDDVLEANEIGGE